MRRTGIRGLLVADSAVALGLLATYLVIASRTEQAWGPVVLLLAGMSLPLAVRRLWPVPVLGVVTALSLLCAILGVVREPLLATAFAAYTVAVTTSPRRLAPNPVVGIAGATVFLGGLVAGTPYQPWSPVLFLMGVALVVIAWSAGWAVRERREHAEQVMRQFAARTVTDERLRIARELHDIVAHHLGVIVVKAGVANHVLPDLPPTAREALHAIETSSRSALSEMRHMLSVLRTGGVEGDGAPALRPSTGLSGLPELLDRVAAAEVDVDLRAEKLDLVPESAGFSAYRIVQEALTNVVKHAAPARCRVSLVASATSLRIEVVDDGPGPGTAGEGHGLVGMRERVALYGGEFHAGAGPGGGFAVTATLPYAPNGRQEPETDRRSASRP
ncbi:Signal transduction histidine kinase [Streptoalloteichus hindustanus]|uniref:histidine kinase n=1 Tax=Streptoalloteichus hindustanus TaxID=2017 RepID=A0A1M5D2Q9_STRHI|nr:Signal transduction histidine kinase [Streptoalloteichus hindustanus]